MVQIEPRPAAHDPNVTEMSQLFHETLGLVPNSVPTMQRWPQTARAAAGVPNAVTPELMTRLRAHWDDGEVVDILGERGWSAGKHAADDG